jgi:hypothetical protein
LALQVGLHGERFAEHLLRWDLCRDVVCGEGVRHEVRDPTFQHNLVAGLSGWAPRAAPVARLGHGSGRKCQVQGKAR